MLQGLYDTEIMERRAVGFCHFHHCYVTSTQLKQKECLKKQCNHLEKQDHDFWRYRESIKHKKKSRKSV